MVLGNRFCNKSTNATIGSNNLTRPKQGGAGDPLGLSRNQLNSHRFINESLLFVSEAAYRLLLLSRHRMVIKHRHVFCNTQTSETVHVNASTIYGQDGRVFVQFRSARIRPRTSLERMPSDILKTRNPRLLLWSGTHLASAGFSLESSDVVNIECAEVRIRKKLLDVWRRQQLLSGSE